MRVLDLFSGVGGIALGLERAGMETAAFCEIDPFARSVLRKHWRGVPIYDDIRGVTAERLAADGVGRINAVCGGDPCQPHSTAGKRRGTDDDRYLWPEYLRIVQEFDPAWVVNENVVGSESNLVLDQKIFDLENAGYECQPFDLPACAVGGGHERRRIYLVAHSRRKGWEGLAPQQQSLSLPARKEITEPGDDILESWGEMAARARNLRRRNGVSVSVVRREIKCYGNAVVPQIPEIIGRAIMEIERHGKIQRSMATL